VAQAVGWGGVAVFRREESRPTQLSRLTLQRTKSRSAQTQLSRNADGRSGDAIKARRWCVARDDAGESGAWLAAASVVVD